MEHWEESLLKKIDILAIKNLETLEKEACKSNIEFDWYFRQYIKALVRNKDNAIT